MELYCAKKSRGRSRFPEHSAPAMFHDCTRQSKGFMDIAVCSSLVFPPTASTGLHPGVPLHVVAAFHCGGKMEKRHLTTSRNVEAVRPRCDISLRPSNHWQVGKMADFNSWWNSGSAKKHYPLFKIQCCFILAALVRQRCML